jgi:polar amino acid transport system substrate-binding protein
MKLVRLFAVLLLLTTVQRAPAAESLDIDVEDAAEPWSRADGTGFANDVVRKAFAAAGVEIHFQVMPYARCKANVLSGTAVACLSMSWENELKDKVVFASEPLFRCFSDFYVSRSRQAAAPNSHSIPAGASVGLVTGYEYPPVVEELKAKGVHVEEAGTEEANIRKLALGRIDYAVLNHNSVKTADQMIGAADAAGKVKLAFSGGELGSFIGFSLAHPRGQWARKKFDEGFRKIKTNGALAELEKRWRKIYVTGK